MLGPYLLDYPANFRFDCHVAPIENDGTPLSSTSAAAPEYRGPIAFTTTHWSVVLQAQGPLSAAQAALEKLCCAYWRPIYGYVRRHGIGPEEAKDLTQGFFALLLERRALNAVRKEKEALRSSFLPSLQHFFSDQRRPSIAIKYGAGP